MSFIYQQFNSFLNLGMCKEYSIMARSKNPTGSKQKDILIPNSTTAVPATRVVAAGTTQTEANRPETRKLEIVKNDSRTNVVPMNLEDEIRRRAYELSRQRGSGGGSETEDWLTAEREVLQRYRQQSA
jgi:hypothetical protein